MSKKTKDRVPLQLSGGVAIAPIRYEITHVVIGYLQEDLLEFVVQNNTHAVVFDLKGLEILDAEDFIQLSKLIRTLAVMGQRVLLCGLSPGIAATIIEQGLDAKDWNTVFDLNEALAKLVKKK